MFVASLVATQNVILLAGYGIDEAFQDASFGCHYEHSDEIHIKHPQERVE